MNIRKISALSLVFLALHANAGYKCAATCAESRYGTLSMRANLPALLEFNKLCNIHGSRGTYASGGGYVACDFLIPSGSFLIENTQVWSSQQFAIDELNNLCPRQRSFEWSYVGPATRTIQIYQAAQDINCHLQN